MIALNILYPAQDGSFFDSGYYFEKHMPSTVQKLQTALRNDVRGRTKSRPARIAAALLCSV